MKIEKLNMQPIRADCKGRWEKEWKERKRVIIERETGELSRDNNGIIIEANVEINRGSQINVIHFCHTVVWLSIGYGIWYMAIRWIIPSSLGNKLGQSAEETNHSQTSSYTARKSIKIRKACSARKLTVNLQTILNEFRRTKKNYANEKDLVNYKLANG